MKTIKFECRKYRMSENADTTLRLSLDIHPDDISAAMELFSHRRGTRFMCVLAEIDDNDQPVPEAKPTVKKTKTIGQRLHILCASKSFQDFICAASEEDAITTVRKAYDVESFKDIAQSDFQQLMNDYQDWLIPPPTEG